MAVDDGVNWTVGACVHGARFPGDDRESMWVDNNPGSPFYGRMYISWNIFTRVGATLDASYSDDGTTWSAPVELSSTFLRNVQVTGSPGTDGTVFVAAMDEEGGGLGSRLNYMFRSTDGGITWTQWRWDRISHLPGTLFVQTTRILRSCPRSGARPVMANPRWDRTASSTTFTRDSE